MVEELTIAKHLTKEEDHRLTKSLDKATCRDSLMLLLLRKYGMRANELLSIKKTDINHNEMTMSVKGSKGSSSRQFPLTPEIFDRLIKVCDESKSDKVFPIKYNRLGDIWRFWRPVDKPLHCLRHTCAIEAYEKKRDILIVKKILGHRDIRTTMIYAEYCDTKTKFAEMFL